MSEAKEIMQQNEAIKEMSAMGADNVPFVFAINYDDSQ